MQLLFKACADLIEHLLPNMDKPAQNVGAVKKLLRLAQGSQVAQEEVCFAQECSLPLAALHATQAGQNGHPPKLRGG